MSDSSKQPSSEEPEIPEEPSRPELPEVPKVRFERPKLPSGPSPEFQQNTKAISLAFSIGFSLAGPVIVGALIGYWLDNRLHTSPTWTVVLVLLGTVAGFIQLIRTVNKMNQD